MLERVFVPAETLVHHGQLLQLAVLEHKIAAGVLIYHGFSLSGNKVADNVVETLLLGSGFKPEVSVGLLAFNTVGDRAEVLRRIAVADPGHSLLLELFISGLQEGRFEAVGVNLYIFLALPIWVSILKDGGRLFQPHIFVALDNSPDAFAVHLLLAAVAIDRLNQRIFEVFF